MLLIKVCFKAISTERTVTEMKALKYRNVIFTIVLCLITSLCFSVPVSADTGENHAQELRIGVPADRCPVFYIDSNTNDVVGIGVDLMRYAAQKAGYTAAFIPIKESNLKDALDNSEYDLLMPFGSAIKSTAGTPSIVTDNLMETPFTLVTVGNRKPSDTEHLRVGMLSSQKGVAETFTQLYPGMTIQMYETMPECVNALRNDEVDALLHNSYVWSYILQKPSYSDLTQQPSIMFSMDFRAGAPDTPEGRILTERINSGIAELSDTQRMAVILDYTSRRLYHYDFADYLYMYSLPIVLSSLLFIALTIIAVQRIRAVRRKHEEKLRWLTEHDPLTGTLSLQGFRRRVTELLREHPDIPYLLAYTNITDFKYINEILGRSAGDDLLRFWAKETEATLSEYEAIARLDSDHLAVLRHIGGEEKIRYDDEAVIDSVRSYFTDRGKENRVQVCGGVYILTPEDYRLCDVDHMLDLARVAEQRVRSRKKDGYEFYNPDQWEKGKRSADIISRLSAAKKTGEIQVWYQPQMDVSTRRIIGAEALCRWNHAKLGWISPAEFIPILEEAGLIFELDFYIWKKVCSDLQRWNRQGLHRTVSVNLSRSDITDERDISGCFCDLIKVYGITTDQLHIEITETAFAENPTLLISTTERLRNAGFSVEMDDFGSGYSSLHMLKEVPVDRIKLDLRFLTKTGDPEKSRIITSYMVQMVSSLGMIILAEGVESGEQAEFLKNKGCSEMQGYYFHKPMPVEDFEKLIHAEKEQAPKEGTK